LHRSIQQGAHAAPCVFSRARRVRGAMSTTLIRARIGESRSKVRAFVAGSGALLPVFFQLKFLSTATGILA